MFYKAPQLVAVVLAGCLSLPARSSLTELKHFDKKLAAQGVQADYSEESMTALMGLLHDELGALKARAAAATGDDQESLQRTADALGGVLERISAVAASSDTTAKAAAFPAMKSLLYSVRSEVQGKRKGGKLGVALGVLGNLSLKLPYLSPLERARPLTAAQARLEAVNLEDPKTGTQYSDPADLAGLSSDQVSLLDVRHDNYLWYAESDLGQLKAGHHTAWNALEARIEARVSEAIHASYKLNEARRILLFRRILSSATSPKVNTRDLYGQEWKLKWGDEVQTETVANRLYVELGGKFTDLVYANQGGPGDLVLVLDQADPQSAEPGCDNVATLDSFKRCLLESKYKFDVSAHVVGHGVITEDTLQQPPFSSASTEKTQLLGREFVVFNESQVEYESGGDDFLRLGAAPMSSGGALTDRVKRGLVLFTYWIHNKDAKDDNSKGVIDLQSSTYVEYMHDLGASLGSLIISGNPNLLKVGDKFVRRRGDSIRFSANMLYLPKAFDRVTYADALWMARKIVALPREIVVGAVATTAWPDFQQEIMAGRLIARRNDIARVFDMGPMMSYDVAPRVISLRTPADRLDAVRRYHLSITTEADEGKAVALLEQFMEECGIALHDGQADWEDQVDLWEKDSKDTSEDPVLETNDCENSVLVALLERTNHPAGLSRRTQRKSDDKPLKACRPSQESLGIRGEARKAPH